MKCWSAEIELDRRVIAREGLVEALAVSAARTIAVTEVDQETVCSPVAVAVAVPGLDGAAVAGRAAGDGGGLPADSSSA